MTIRVVNVPAGEAPDEVRAAWIGLVLPVQGPQRLIDCKTVGVITGFDLATGQTDSAALERAGQSRGYQVNSKVAIERLSVHAPEAAAWWRQNTPHLLRSSHFLLFQEEACVVEDSRPTAGLWYRSLWFRVAIFIIAAVGTFIALQYWP